MNPLQALADDLHATADLLRQGIPDAVQRPVAMVLVADVQDQFYNGHDASGQPFAPLKFPRPAGGNRPLLNQAILANSYTAETDPRGVTVGSSHVAAALHQFGGVIRPVKAKALTIPLTKEASQYGSPRRFPRPLFVAAGGLVERTGQGPRAKLVKHFLFVRSVTVPARPVGFSQQAQDDAAELVADYYTRVI
jgi:phage gpG-like protein